MLRGPSLTVRPLDSGDFAALYSVARDPLIWAQHPVPDRYRLEVFQQFFADSLACGGTLAVATTEAEVIGSSRFHGYHEQESEVEIGWTFLARSRWGGAANRELKGLMLQHAFRWVERVVFLVGDQNLRSQRSLEKLGAIRAGSRDDGAGNQSALFELRRQEAPAWLRDLEPRPWP